MNGPAVIPTAKKLAIQPFTNPSHRGAQRTIYAFNILTAVRMIEIFQGEWELAFGKQCLSQMP